MTTIPGNEPQRGSLTSAEQRQAVKRSSSPSRCSSAGSGSRPTASRSSGSASRSSRAVLAGLQLWLLAGIVVIVGGVFDMFDGALARATGRSAARGVLRLHLRPLGRGGHLGGHHRRLHRRRHRPGRLALGPRDGVSASWSATPVPARRGSGFSPGSGLASVGLAPREVRARDPRRRPRPRGPARRRHRVEPVGPHGAARHAGTPAFAPRRGRDLRPRDHHRRPAYPVRPEPGEGERSAAADPPAPVSGGPQRPRTRNPTGTGRSPLRGSTPHAATKALDRDGGRRSREPRIRARRRARSASRSSASATARAASSRAATTTRTRSRATQIPGLMHVDLGGYHVRDIEFVAAFDIDREKVGKDLSEAIYAGQNNTYVFQQVPQLGVKVDRGMTHDGLGQVPLAGHQEGPGPDGGRRGHPQGAQGRRHGLLPAGRQRGGDEVVRRAGAPGGRRRSSTRSRSSSAVSRTGSAGSPRPGCRSSATTSRARSARPSPTASSPACSWTAASASTARTS